MSDLPIYDINLGDLDYGVYAISLVENPATESDFIYMSADEEVNQFVFADEEKREVIGAILVPDKLIYRKIDGREFYVKFSADVIKEINSRMQKTDGNKMFTVEHELGANGTVEFLESWIKETEEDKSSAFGIDVPLGSLMIKAKVESDLLWDMIKAERLKGFSVELDASIIRAELSKIIKDDRRMELDFKKMYENSLTVNDTELLFNGELDINSVVFAHTPYDEETETFASVAPYSGEFQVDNVKYQAVSGLITEKLDIILSYEEKFDAILNAFNELKEEFSKEKEVEEEDKLDAILTKIEEDRLIKSQEVEKEEETLEESASEFSVEDYRSVSEWYKKWN